MSNNILVEVAFALPTKQFLLQVSLPAESTVSDALRDSGVEAQFENVEFAELDVGVWGKTCARSQRLKGGDRIEVYRPLEIDPRETRRLLAQVGKTMGQAPVG